MKVLKLLAVTAALSASGLAMADGSVVDQGYAFEANQLIPTGARLEVGTTGYGGALLWTANPYVGLALGYNGGDISWSDDLKINGSKYDLDMDNKLAYLNAEIRPWGASQNVWAQGLYVAAGVGYVDNEYGLERRISQGRNFTVNNTDFNAASDVQIKGKQKYDNQFAPYVGFGFAPKINKNFGVFGEVGAYYTGNPNVSLQQVAGTDQVNGNGDRLSDAIRGEAYKISNDDKYNGFL
jgi:hypothetical protein